MEMNNTSEKKIRVAVIGSGLAGLTAAYLLARDTAKRYSVEIFEMVCDQFHSFSVDSVVRTDTPLIQGPSPSLDAASMTVSLTDADSGKLNTSRLDVPMRAFAGGFYKNLISLYTHLGIPYKRKDFLYTFSNSSSSPHLSPTPLESTPTPAKTNRPILAFPPAPAGSALRDVLLFQHLCLLHRAQDHSEE